MADFVAGGRDGQSGIRVGDADAGGAGAHAFDGSKRGGGQEVGAHGGGEQHQREPGGQFVAQVYDRGVAVGEALGRNHQASTGGRACRHPHRALQIAQRSMISDQLPVSGGVELRA